MGITLISLPTDVIRSQDSDGFAVESLDYIQNIRAQTRPKTTEDETLAAAAGFTLSKIYIIAQKNYSDQSYLVDRADGEYYDIKKTIEKGRMLWLYTEARKHGKIYDAARD